MNTIKEINLETIKTIEYFYNEKEGCLIKTCYEDLIINKRSLFLMNNICMSYLSSITSYRKAIKKLFNFSYSIPIVLNLNLIFIQTSNLQNYDNIWINFGMIKNVKKDKNGSLIVFKSDNTLRISNNTGYFKKQIEQINIIYDYYKKINL